MNPKNVAIIGASGYSGEELVRLLLNHPLARLVAVTSRQYAGKTLAQVFPRFASHPTSRSLRFTDPDPAALAREADVVFLALPHGVAAEYAIPLLDAGRVVIDLSADFRLRNAETYQSYYHQAHPAPEWLEKSVYGLPERYRTQLRDAKMIASPGCYPTSILIPTLPLLEAGLIQSQGIIADCLSGVSGAGRKADLAYLYCECQESLRAYGVPRHRHLSEIEEQLSFAAKTEVTIQFTPHLVPVQRGIHTTLYFYPKTPWDSPAAMHSFGEQIEACYQAAYGEEPFVRLLDAATLPDTKHVVGTNTLELAWRLDPRTGRLLIFSAEDNVIKGASGQAVQSFNLRFGYPETTGLIA
jgi:N-acetyl-gamma-glutamyl-phosphate reductase